MAATDSRPVPRKNVAYRVYFPILDADGDLVSVAAALDSEVSIDGAAFADCTNEATEIGTSGIYYLDLTAGEMNGDAVVVQVKTSSSGAKTTVITFYPEEVGDFRVNVEQFGGASGTFSGGRPEVNTSHAGGVAWGSGAITAASIAADAITNAKIANGAIDAATFAAGAIDASAIAADAITAAKIANGAIDAATFAAGAIDAAAIADGAIDAATFAAGAINAAAIAADAITDAKVAADVTIASVTGSVGSVTGNVGGNVVGSVGSVATGGISAASFAAGAIDSAAIAADAIGSAELAASAANEIRDAIFARAFGAAFSSLTFEQLIHVMVAALAGKLTGAATTTITIRNLADTASVIVATVDADGNRTALTITP